MKLFGNQLNQHTQNHLKKMNKEKKRLYLDDVRTPKGDDWVIVRNYEHFVSEIV